MRVSRPAHSTHVADFEFDLSFPEPCEVELLCEAKLTNCQVFSFAVTYVCPVEIGSQLSLAACAWFHILFHSFVAAQSQITAVAYVLLM